MVGLRVPVRSSLPAVETRHEAKSFHTYGRNMKLSRTPFVAMMQTTDLWERDNLAGSRWL
jgi:hypothetical protein